MSIIINTNSREEYNNKINFYQMKGFKFKSSTSSNLQTHLEKKNFGPVWSHILLIISLIGILLYMTELVIYPLALTDLFIRLNLFSLLLAVRYLQYVGIILLIICIIMIIVIMYYYISKPYDVFIRLNQNNNQIFNNNNNNNMNFNPNRGNFNG